MCSEDTLLAKYMMWVIPSWNQGNLMHSGEDHYPTIILELAAKGVFVEKKSLNRRRFTILTLSTYWKTVMSRDY